MGAPPGDLYITTNVEDHPLFRREGDNIQLKISPVTVARRASGRVEYPAARRLDCCWRSPGTQNEQKFRLRERGVFNARKNARGDQIVQVVIKAPVVQDERTKELLRELATLHVEDPRKDLWEEVDHVNA